MNDDHIPVPFAHRGRVMLGAIQQPDGTFTIQDMENDEQYLTSDTVVAIKQ